MDYQKNLYDVTTETAHLQGQGEVASYIPELAKVDPHSFGISLHFLQDEHYELGHAEKRFSIQSIAKVFSLSMAIGLLGKSIFQRVGVEPSCTAFNSLLQLDYEQGIPRNPFINAGALVVVDILISELEQPKQSLLELVRKLAAHSGIDFNQAVVASEKSQGFRNAALANLLKSHGKLPGSNEQILTTNQTKRLNTLMQTCGFYDEAGEFSFTVGLPGKSGVGGGIVAVYPEKFSISVRSPELNSKGNSIRGMKTLELFTTKSKLSVF